MKFKLSASASSSCQEPQFVRDLKFEDAAFPLVAPTDPEIAELLPTLSEIEDPIPNADPSDPVIRNLSDVPDSADEPGVAPASWNQADDDVLGATDRDASEADTGQPNINGEANVESESTGATRNSVQLVETAKSPDSFVVQQWPYLLIAVTLVGWVLSQLFVRRDPSFKPHTGQPPKGNKKAEIVGDKPRGQFKRSERFMKPKEKEEPEKVPDPTAASVAEKPRPAETDVLEGKLTQQQRADTMPVDQPSDDNFDFDLSDGGSDSDVFSLEDANEINLAADAKISGASSERFKTEDDVDALSLAGADLEIEDDVVSFDDQDSQIALADSDTEFGFDLGDEGSNSFLDSGKKASETMAKDTGDVEIAGVADVVGEGLGDLSLGGIADQAKDAVSNVADGAQASLTAGAAVAGTAAAGAVAAGAAAKGGFFSRLFGSKNKKQATADAADDLLGDDIGGDVAPAISGQVDQVAGAVGELAVPGFVDDSMELDAVADVQPVESFDLDDDDGSNFDFDLDDDDDGNDSGLPTAVDADEDVSFDLGSDGSDLDDSGELSFDLEDEDEEVAVEALVDEPAAEVAQLEEATVDSDASDSDELSFDLEDEDEEVAVEALVDEPAVEVAQLEDATVDFDASGSGEMQFELEDEDSDASDSGELSFDLEDEDEEVAVEALVDEPAVEVAQLEDATVDSDASDSGEMQFELEDEDEETSVVAMDTQDDEIADEPLSSDAVEDVAVGSDQDDSEEFGFGLFEEGEADAEAVEALDVNSDDDVVAGPSVAAAPVVAAATAAVGLGLAGIGLAGSGSADTSESDSQWEVKHRLLEGENGELSSQVAALTKQLEETKKTNSLSGELQQEHDALTETVKSLGSEKDELLKEKEQAEQENNRLAEELAAAEKNSSTWEQEKADLVKQQEELKAGKEAANADLESLTAKQDESAGELAELKAEVEAFTDQRSEFESEIKTLQTKLADAEAKSAESASDPSEDIKDLKERFRRRLGAEHAKRKQAEQLVEEAESQRNEVAKLLRAAKAELKELKS